MYTIYAEFHDQILRARDSLIRKNCQISTRCLGGFLPSLFDAFFLLFAQNRSRVVHGPPMRHAGVTLALPSLSDDDEAAAAHIDANETDSTSADTVEKFPCYC